MSDTAERQRLETLGRYNLLDTAAEQVFDDLTRLAAAISGSPISLVSIVDDHRQWFKSRVGLDAEQTPRDQAFCAHAILDNTPFIIEDATRDQRFVDNPLVTGEPNIRFYAGMPLIVEDGSALGTLCVIDREPRTLTDKQISALEVLRDAVVSNFELRKAMHEIKTMRQLLPMCAWCGSVKDENLESGEVKWLPLEQFVEEHSAVTHGICPSCSRNMVESGVAGVSGRIKQDESD
ncbi:MAG: GAF domain-containing protein [Pseudomonadota bacterium]